MKARILLVEDDEFLHQLYKDLLIQEGYDVVGSKKGDDALNKIKENNWDLILLDVLLPVMDGFEVLENIRFSSLKLKCPVVYLTNLDSTDKDKAKLSKADFFWTKSNMSPPDFIKNVKSLLK